MTGNVDCLTTELEGKQCRVHTNEESKNKGKASKNVVLGFLKKTLQCLEIKEEFEELLETPVCTGPKLLNFQYFRKQFVFAFVLGIGLVFFFSFEVSFFIGFFFLDFLI